MPADDARDVVLAFNAAINARDLDGLDRLMTDAHVFVDSAGNAIRGRSGAIAAWRGFLAAFPDYRNVFETIRAKDGLVAVAGRSTCSDRRLHGPALWTARITDGRVAEWRVHDDTPERRRRLGLPHDTVS